MQNVDTLLDVIYWYARKQSLHVTIDLSGSGVKGIHWREAFSLRRWRWIVHTIDLDSLKGAIWIYVQILERSGSLVEGWTGQEEAESTNPFCPLEVHQVPADTKLGTVRGC